VKLKDSIVSSLRFFKTRENTEIAWIDAVLDLTKAKTDTSVKPDEARNVGGTEGCTMHVMTLFHHVQIIIILYYQI